LIARFSELAAKVSKVSTNLLDPSGSGVVGSVECGKVESQEGMVDIATHLRNVADANHIGWDDPIPLGKLIMLSGPDWWGRFDLTDPVSRGSYQANAEQAIAKAQKSPQL
jgi:hypothetical protein